MAAAAGEEKTEAPALSQSASAASGGSKLVLILSAVNVVATLGMAVILFISFQRERKRTSVEDIVAQASNEGEGAKGEGKEGEKGKEGKEGKEGQSKPGTKKKTYDFGKMVTLDPFTVNLSTPGSVNPKFVRANISLEVPNEDTEGELTSKMPEVRNAILDLFNSKRPSDLATTEGRDYLKEEIKNALNSFMVTGKVRGVFFTNFVLTS